VNAGGFPRSGGVSGHAFLLAVGASFGVLVALGPWLCRYAGSALGLEVVDEALDLSAGHVAAAVGVAGVEAHLFAEGAQHAVLCLAHGAG
jgi:hypothetical protein